MSLRPEDLPRNLQSRSMLAGQAGPAAAEVEQALRPPVQHDVAAFFDVDNTIVRGATILLLAKGGIRNRLFNPKDIANLAWMQLYFKLFGEKLEHIDEARSSALSLIAGQPVAELEALAEEVFDRDVADRIWPGTLALTQWHLDRGHQVWIMTAAPVEVARIIARRLGLTGALGTVAEHQNGVYTGRLVGEMLHGPAKAAAVVSLAQTEGLDLEKCYAYSDSSNDLPMLSLVGHPCAINPDSTLRDHARAAGWKIRDYRTGRIAAVRAARVLAAGLAAAIAVAIVARLRKR